MLGGGKNFARQRPQTPIQARTLNRPIEAAERQTRAHVGPGLAAQLVAGVPCERALIDREVLARITGGGTGGVYAWRGIYADPATPGAYLDLPANISGTTSADPAYELNGNTLVAAGTRAELRREWATGRLVFQLDAC